MIKRSNPDIAHLSENVFEAYAFTQTIRTGNNIYLSGIAPLRAATTILNWSGRATSGRRLVSVSMF